MIGDDNNLSDPYCLSLRLNGNKGFSSLISVKFRRGEILKIIRRDKIMKIEKMKIIFSTAKMIIKYQPKKTYELVYEAQIKVCVTNTDCNINIENITIDYMSKGDSRYCYDEDNQVFIKESIPSYEFINDFPDLKIKKEINIKDEEVIIFYNEVKENILEQRSHIYLEINDFIKKYLRPISEKINYDWIFC